jgi:hypothetical protein
VVEVCRRKVKLTSVLSLLLFDPGIYSLWFKVYPDVGGSSAYSFGPICIRVVSLSGSVSLTWNMMTFERIFF